MIQKTDVMVANKDTGTMIKTCQALMIHARYTRKDFNPADPSKFVDQSMVQVYQPKEWEKLEDLNVNRIPMDHVRVSGWQECKVIHDGRLVAKDEILKKEIDDYWYKVLHPVVEPPTDLVKLVNDVKRLKRVSAGI